MRALLIAFGILSISAFSNAQEVLPTEIESIHSKYGGFEFAVMMMDRTEWETYRSWEGYDQEAVIAVIKRHQNTPEYLARKEARKQQRLLRSGSCECWIEPDETYTEITPEMQQFTGGAGIDVDYSHGPLSLPFTFNLFGLEFDEFYINSKGLISFSEPVIDWTPEELPDANYNIISGYWGDADYRLTGDIFYRITPTAVYVNWVDVGYYNNHDERTVSYQIVFSEDGSVAIGGGAANVQMCYENMEWAHGDVGGEGGCCGPDPATVGIDVLNNDDEFVQFGRFNFTDDSYNGPYGGGEGEQDGCMWLNGKDLCVNVSGSDPNQPPIATETPGGGCDDTLFVCLNDTLDLNLGFLAPEPGQTISIELTDLDAVTNNGTYVENGVTYLDAFLAGTEDNVGIYNLDITATDDGTPTASTSLSFVVEVIDVVLPSLSVEGDFSICSGQETTITCNDDFDSYFWSLGCFGPECTYEFGGTFTVTASIDEGCSTSQDFFIDQSLYFLPDVCIEPNPICGDDTAIVTVCDPDMDSFVEYEWDGDWNGAGGEIVIPGDTSIGVTPGSFRILITNDDGCEGQRVFNVEQVTQVIPDITIPPVCDSLYSVQFEGGYTTPDAGPLLVYMTSSEPTGWGGDNFLEVVITDADGVESNYVLASFEVFTAHTDIEVSLGDLVEITLVTGANAPVDDFSFTVYNCTTTNPEPVDDLPAGGGLVYSTTADCVVDPVGGTWSVGVGTGFFSDPTEFNTFFTPTSGLGIYEVCFTDDNCGYSACYEMETSTTPTGELIGPANNLVDDNTYLLCDGEAVNFQMDTTFQGTLDPIDWPQANSSQGLFAEYEFNGEGEYDLSVTLSNLCGTLDFPFTILTSNQADPELEDVIVCEDGTEVILDSGLDPSDDADLSWTFNNGTINGEDEAILTADEAGDYCIEASNECGTAEACAEVQIFVPIPNPLPAYSLDCEGGNTVLVDPLTDNDWTVTWEDGTVADTYTATFVPHHNEWLSATFEDPLGCTSFEDSTFVWMGYPVEVGTPQPVLLPSEGPLFLCPEIPNTFQINSTFAVEWNWTIEVANQANSAIQIPGLNADETTFTTAQFDNLLDSSYYNSPLILTGTGYNPCSTGGVSGTWQVEWDNCDIIIPNIFTPGTAEGSFGKNDTFEIQGLLKYDGAILAVYDRWGNQVFYSENYDNLWNARDVSSGTHYYLLSLPNGRDFSGSVMIAR
ncbi:gliding motility-associated C-terminal domain-containing protein [Flavobacteriales bacterium]|nr:gliding motility-associated C-terminal domain-containing protein [Flavobacteriales bacterium]